MEGQRALERRVQRRFLPFAAVGVLALLLAVLPPQPERWTLIWVATGLTLAIAAVGVLAPWSRLPRSTYIVLPLAYLVVVAILREAHEGGVSGYGPLALLPVVWIATNLGRREVAIGIAVGTFVFAMPPLVGDSSVYGPGEWRRAVIWALVATLVGFALEALVQEKRRQARASAEQAERLARSEETLSRIVQVVRGLTASGDTRAEVCQAALDVSGASVAAIVEADGAGDLVVTAHAGGGLGRDRFRMGEVSASTVVFATGERLFTPDVGASDVIPPDIVEATGMVTGLCEPIQRDGKTVGVLAVGWPERIDDMDEQATQAIVLLAAQAASAMERADLLAQLERRARTDDLTGLPNRRSWDETIHAAVANAEREGRGLCVALVDLDHFKRFNDEHGHQAGDRLLKSAAAAWRGALREGDTLARYGGEEFAVALPRCGLEEAERVLERLRRLTPDGQTCSVGLAAWDGAEPDVQLVGRADEALYRAKRGGRNAVVAVVD